jgi:hypothetical protein
VDQRGAGRLAQRLDVQVSVDLVVQDACGLEALVPGVAGDDLGLADVGSFTWKYSGEASSRGESATAFIYFARYLEESERDRVVHIPKIAVTPQSSRWRIAGSTSVPRTGVEVVGTHPDAEQRQRPRNPPGQRVLAAEPVEDQRRQMAGQRCTSGRGERGGRARYVGQRRRQPVVRCRRPGTGVPVSSTVGAGRRTPSTAATSRFLPVPASPVITTSPGLWPG